MPFARWLQLAAPVLLALVFLPQLSGAFVWDDVPLIEHNAALRSPEGYVALLTQDLWGQATGASSQLYHPLPMLSLWLQTQGFGAGLGALRLVNIALHAVVVWLFVRWLERRCLAPGLAHAAGLLVLLHPSVCEPVMWITGRHDTLAMLATLLALCSWPADPRAPHADLRALASGLALAAAFLCKEPYVVAAPLLGLQVWLLTPAPTAPPRWRSGVRWLLALLPLAAAFGLRRALGISLGSAQAHVGMLQHAHNFASIVWHYGAQLVRFRNGVTFAPFVPLGAAPAVAVWALILGVSAGLAWLALRRQRPDALPLFGWAWFLVALTPHLISAPSIGFYGNRYGYCALFGLATCAASLCARLPALTPRSARLAFAAVLLMAAVSALGTHLEAEHWHDNVRLYSADVARDPDNGYALYHLGTALVTQSGCGAALPLFTRASELVPRYERALHNVSGCLIQLGQAARALPYAERSVELAPGNPGARYNLAIAQVASGQRSRGLAELQAVLRLDPHHAGAARAMRMLSEQAPRAP